MLVYSSFKMERDSAVRGYREAQINRFESQLSEINLLHKLVAQFSRSWRPGRSITVDVDTANNFMGEWKFCAV